MTIKEVEQLDLKNNDRIIIKSYLIDITNDTGKATFVTIKQPDKRKKEFYLYVRYYKYQTLNAININEIISITKGWN
jgi:hypothetical protein